MTNQNRNKIVIPNNNLSVCVQAYQWKFVNNTGNITWATTCAIPSNIPTKRVWNINLSGNINKKSYKHILKGDFNKVKTFGYNITFEGPIQGTITIDGKVLDANKYINWNYDDKKQIMIWTITNLCKKGLFEMNIFINDASCNTLVCPVASTNISSESDCDSFCKQNLCPQTPCLYCYEYSNVSKNCTCCLNQ